MIPNPRHLRIVSEVARRRGINAAAQTTNLSQPAVTHAVAGVERSLGAALFERSNTGMELTPAGSLAMARIERALEHLDDGLAELTRTAKAGAKVAVTAAQLRTLIAIVDHGSFGAAARATDVSHPTLHRAARQLETLLGVALFETTSFGIQPTRAAESLARHAKLATAELRQARIELLSTPDSEAGATAIGALPLSRSLLLPRVLVEFSALYPSHEVAIREGAYEDLIAALRGGEIDFLIGAQRQNAPFSDLRQEFLFDDELAIGLRAEHPLASRRKATARMLAEYPWVAPRRGSPLRGHYEQLFKNAGIAAPPGAIECNSMGAARALLLMSDRVMLLSKQQIRHELETGMLAALPHPHGSVTRAIAMTLRRSWMPTEPQTKLVRLLHDHALRVNSGA